MNTKNRRTCATNTRCVISTVLLAESEINQWRNVFALLCMYVECYGREVSPTGGGFEVT
jgi:hypothetical protein